MAEAEWQRLAPLALVFLILKGSQKFVRENLFLFVGAGAGAAFLDWIGPRELLLGLLAVLLIILASAMIYHRRFRFRLEEDAVRVRRGLLVRRELRIRFGRVQNIQLGQPFYFRPFGLVRFSLETPGAAEKEVELPGIPMALAEQMRDRIAGVAEPSPDCEHLEAAADDEIVSIPAESEQLLFAVTSWRLFVHGLSSNQIWLLVGAFVYLFGTFSERALRRLSDTEMYETVSGTAASGPWLWVALVILIAAGLFILSGLLALVRFHGFRLLDRKGRVVGSGGLLDRREQTVRRTKITGLTLRQTALGRLWGAWYLMVRQTTSGANEVDYTRQGFVVPGLSREDMGLVGDLVTGWQVPESFSPISARYRQRYWLFNLLLFLPALIALSTWLGQGHFVVVLVGLALALATLLTHLRYRRWGWSLNGYQLWVRQGLLGHSLEVFEIDRVQQTQITQSPYQRRHDLASLNLVLPQGSVSIPFLPLEEAAALANQALYAAETSMMHRV
ncbi:MAG: PH domain-containing protein [Wenzhouxiangella sp.]|nr:PH domain-containing protein [Wenzhouxiangella sp.]